MTMNVPAIEKFNVVKGFLNLSVSASYWLNLLHGIAADPDWGIRKPEADAPLVMVEYSSPNTNKPLHLGHVRNNLLGYSLSQILAANGNKVVKTNIVNDRGIHICKSMLAWKKWGENATPESTGKKGDHLIGDFYVAFDKHFRQEVKEIMERDNVDEDEAKRRSPLMTEAHEMLVKWEQGDPEVRTLWKMMNDWVYAGSVWADLTDEGLDQKLLLRPDGTSVYMTQDIGTAKLRFRDYPIDKMIYVVGNEQNYHFQVLSILLDRLGFKWGKDLTHFSYGMVELPEGKMKSREGTVVDADDLMDTMVEGAREMAAGRLGDMTAEEASEVSRMVGMGALKYFLLKVDPKKNMLFNPKESIDFNGNTGPFIQYTYARIQSLIRKAGDFNPVDTPDVEPNAKECALIMKIADFPNTVADAGRNYSPAIIANYAYDLAKEYNQFYHDYSILREENESVKRLRLLISYATARTLRSAMSLLGIEMPERM